ncbi:MAG: hypothetical protein HY054_16215 [Proteobacteria bacterium]|nr:hypothetical protein [Pseudomonadota bacterium]
MRKRLLAALGGFVLAACSGPVLADTPSLFATLTRPGACFARTYDSAHLTAHPRQTVRRFFVREPGAEWRPTQAPGHFDVAFGFQIIGSSDTYAGMGICTPNGARAACDIEGDGGSFTISRHGDGLRIDTARIEAEGAHDFSPDLAAGDNRVMLLRPAAAPACAAP